MIVVSVLGASMGGFGMLVSDMRTVRVWRLEVVRRWRVVEIDRDEVS